MDIHLGAVFGGKGYSDNVSQEMIYESVKI